VTWRVALSIAVTLAVTVVDVAMVPVPGAEAAMTAVVAVGGSARAREARSVSGRRRSGCY
jgi:hypothetical protein